MKYKFNQFNPNKMLDNRLSVFQGPSGTGKSVCLKHILSYKQDIPSGIVISETEEMDEFFSNFIPKLFIHDEYTDDLVMGLLHGQKKLAKKIKKGKLDPESVDIRKYLIMDDVMGDDNWTRRKPIKKIFTEGRHFQCSTFICMQYPLGVPPNLRSNIHYVFIQQFDNYKDIMKLYDNYMPAFKSKDEFLEVYDQLTANYGTMVLDNTIRSRKITDKIFWFQADPSITLKMGPEEVWAYSEANCKDNNDSDSDDDDAEIDYMNPRRPNVEVQKIKNEN
jgi:hypothetical protein